MDKLELSFVADRAADIVGALMGRRIEWCFDHGWVKVVDQETELIGWTEYDCGCVYSWNDASQLKVGQGFG